MLFSATVLLSVFDWVPAAEQEKVNKLAAYISSEDSLLLAVVLKSKDHTSLFKPKWHLQVCLYALKLRYLIGCMKTSSHYA